MCLVNYRKLAVKVCSTVKILTDFAGVELSSSSSCCDSESSLGSSSLLFVLFTNAAF